MAEVQNSSFHNRSFIGMIALLYVLWYYPPWRISNQNAIPRSVNPNLMPQE